MVLKLTIANKAYSSWSLRPWLLLAHFKIPFEEEVVFMRQPNTRERMLKVSPTGKVPSLKDGSLHVWESLAILEYIAEAYPQKAIWPRLKAARAHARSLSSEMHAGFVALRSECPTNFRRKPHPPKTPLSAAALADVARIEAAFAQARAKYGKAGPFLFGKFSAADAMFAPVINRLYAYDIKVNPATKAYMDAVMALPAWIAWHKDGAEETQVIADYEAY